MAPPYPASQTVQAPVLALQAPGVASQDAAHAEHAARVIPSENVPPVHGVHPAPPVPTSQAVQLPVVALHAPSPPSHPVAHAEHTAVVVPSE